MMLLKGTRIAILAVIGLLSSTLSLGAPLPQIKDPSGLASGIGEDPRGQFFGVQLDQVFKPFGDIGFVSYSAIFKVLTPAQVSDDFLMRIARAAYTEMRDVHDRWAEAVPDARGLEIPHVMAIMDMGDNVIYAASSVKFPAGRSGASIEAYRALQIDMPDSISKCLWDLQGDHPKNTHRLQGLCGEVNLLRLDADMQTSQGATTYYQPGENTRMVAWNGNENEAVKFCAGRGPKEFGCENINEHYSRKLTLDPGGEPKNASRLIKGRPSTTDTHGLTVEQQWNVRHQIYDPGHDYHSDKDNGGSGGSGGSDGSGGGGGGGGDPSFYDPYAGWDDSELPPPSNQEHAAQIAAQIAAQQGRTTDSGMECSEGSADWIEEMTSWSAELKKWARQCHELGWPKAAILASLSAGESSGTGQERDYNQQGNYQLYPHNNQQGQDQSGYNPYDQTGGRQTQGDQDDVQAQINRLTEHYGNLGIGRKKRSEDRNSGPGVGKSNNKPEAAKSNGAAKSKSNNKLRTGKTQDPRAHQPGKGNNGQAKACRRPTPPLPPPPPGFQRLLNGKGKGKSQNRSKNTSGNPPPSSGGGGKTKGKGKPQAPAAAKDNKTPAAGKGNKGPAGQAPSTEAKRKGASPGKKTTKSLSASGAGKATQAAKAAA